MSLITCENLSFAYDGVVICDQLSFQVEDGDYLCIVGENGAGKSTLVKGLLHLKKPAGGSLSYGDGLRADEIGYLPQQTQIQKDFPASVQEVVLSLTQTMYDYIYKVNRKMGITVIMVSHDLEAALRYATNILQIGHRQLFFGTPEEYRKSPQYRMLVQSRSTRHIRIPSKNKGESDE